MKKSFYFFLGLILFSISFAGCDNYYEGYLLNERTISFITFNARLTNDLPLYDERIKKLEVVLNEADSDVICIQEVYGNNNLSAVTKHLKSDALGYKSVIYASTDNDDFDPIPPACTDNDLAPVYLCIADKCGLENLDSNCIITNCWQTLLTLPPVCQNCMIGQGIGAVAGGDFQEILTGCMSEKIIKYEFSGNSGVILASKYPLKDKGFLGLTSTGTYKTALYATLGETVTADGEIVESKPGIGDIQIICAGLSPLSDSEYDGVAGSWANEQTAQVNEILSIPVKGSVVQRVIMGDFNGNPAAGLNILEQNPGPVSILLTEGWYNPYLSVSPDTEIDCTVCPENPFIDNAGKQLAPDHILFKEKKRYLFSSERLFLNEFILFNDKTKTKTRFSISDHYGLKTRMTLDPNF